jgi:hypothetical protein
VSEDRDLERRLEAMFASAKPRQDFEDELWRRIGARRPWRLRVRAWLESSHRLAPAFAAFVVLAVGVGWLATHVNFRGVNNGASSTAGSARYGSVPGFGVLPSMASAKQASGSAAGSPGPVAPQDNSSPALTFSGSLPVLPGELPVYRYDEPSSEQLNVIRSSLSATSGLEIAVSASQPAAGIEPRFAATGLAAPVDQPLPQAADAFLAAHGLRPAFPYQVTAEPGGVLYGRQLEADSGPIEVIGLDGRPSGLEVASSGDSLVGVSGPLDLPLPMTRYPLRPAGDALAAAGVRVLPAGGGAPAFDRARVVYVLVISGGHGYYEPELLLTGPGGTAFAPVIAQTWLGR